MTRITLVAAFVLAPLCAAADTTLSDIINAHILPRFDRLASTSQTLAQVAQQDCAPTSPALRMAYGDAFDAWIAASHLRFGPTETGDRAFALAFWPDTRGATPRALAALLSDQDPIAGSAAAYAQVSIAARGFYAMEFLLYDDALMHAGDPAYHCQLVQTISADIAVTADAIRDDWRPAYAQTMQTPQPDGHYRTPQDALQALFKSLSTGLQFTADTRLGRPLGTFDRPRPLRAEARRAGRSAAHVKLSLLALQDLAARLAGDNTDLSAALDAKFARALSQVDALDDPVFAGVAVPETRIKVDILQQSITAIRTLVRDELGPTLGVAAGFNALDGD